MAGALPVWRRSIEARLASVALALLPALAWQAWQLQAALLPRFTALVLLAGATAALLSALLDRRVQARPSARPSRTALLLDAGIQAALVAALWPAQLPLWPVLIGLALALAVQRLLGGWAVNPFPPALLTLCIGIALGRGFSGTDFTPPLSSLIDNALVASGWLLLGLLPIGLRIWPARAPLAFLLPTVSVFLLGGIASSALVTGAILAGFVVADTRHLPATPAGQCLLGLLAGLGASLLWLLAAPPLAIVFPLLAVFALAPWIEQLSLKRPVVPESRS